MVSAEKQPRRHYLVDFATRYSGWRISNTLNARAAIWRAESLIGDAGALIKLSADAEAKGIQFGTVRKTFEVVDYFAVGYVTCLEWHARSRLVDLMQFRPSCIEANDVKKIADLALSQMIAEGVTVPQLLGAAASVSQIREYLEIFKRVFSELGISEAIERELKATRTNIDLYTSNADCSLYGILNHVFDLRNQLVHEIGLGIVGHQSIRDVWDPSRAVEFGEAVVAAMKLIEAKIRELAPSDFPNRLNHDFFPEDELEKLSAQISDIEQELSASLVGFDCAAPWRDALMASRISLEKELCFIDSADFFSPVWHLSPRRRVQIEYLKARLRYLELLKSEALG